MFLSTKGSIRYKGLNNKAQHSSSNFSFLKRKVAQTQSMELIAVLFVFLIILSVGIYYYYQFQFSDIKSSTQNLINERLGVYLVSIPNMPEFQCSFRASKEICLDATKLLLFKSSELSKSVTLPKARITVKQLYPIKTSTKECVLQDFNSPDFPDNCLYFTIKDLNLKERRSIISNPVLLYYPNKNIYALGSLIMEVD